MYFFLTILLCVSGNVLIQQDEMFDFETIEITDIIGIHQNMVFDTTAFKESMVLEDNNDNSGTGVSHSNSPSNSPSKSCKPKNGKGGGTGNHCPSESPTNNSPSNSFSRSASKSCKNKKNKPCPSVYVNPPSSPVSTNSTSSGGIGVGGGVGLIFGSSTLIGLIIYFIKKKLGMSNEAPIVYDSDDEESYIEFDDGIQLRNIVLDI